MTLAAAENSMERLAFIKSSDVIPDDVKQTVTVKGFNMLIACYYNLLKDHGSTRDEIMHVKDYLYRYAKDIETGQLSKGIQLRWLLLKLHMASLLAEVEGLFRE